VHYDLVSSLITVGALTTVMGFWMLAASYAREESNAVELRIWGLSCLVFGVSFALFATREIIPIFWSLVVGNFFFGLGFGGFGAAIAHLFNRRFPYRTVVLGILVCSLALYVTEVIHGDSSWRVLILAAVTVVPWTVSAIQCTQEWRARPAPHILAMSLAFLTVILISISRLMVAAYHGSFGYTGLPTQSGYLLGSHILLTSPVLLTVGFFLLSAERTHQTTKKLADTDPLTEILNRRSAILLADNRMASARRHHQVLSCVAFDLDRLKPLNDVHGHAAGDQALIHLTRVVGKLTRKEDIFGRVGGDEFVVFMPYSDLHGATALAERFRAAIAASPLRYEGVELTITGSFGVASLQDGDVSALDLLDRADRALYKAKKRGGNAVMPAVESR
jgi:diguanylate cyclase (GGDEF)-like protein